ncbi:MAG: hypothetical protein WBO36_13920 [Saprospiraceae bacterium]
MNLLINIKKWCLWVIWICMITSVSAQVTTSIAINKDSLLIGDPIILDITIKIPQNDNIEALDLSFLSKITNLAYEQDTLSLEKYADLEIIDGGKWKIDDINQPLSISSLEKVNDGSTVTIKNQLTVAIYNMGVYDLLPPTLIADPSVQILTGEAKRCMVYLPEKLMSQDTVAFNPIKDIMVEKANISDYMIYMYILLGLILMAAVSYYFYKLKHKNVSAPITKVVKVIPAHEKALTALQQLDQDQVWQHGKIKEYQTRLTDIIRTYLEDRFRIGAPEMTSFEINQALSKAADFDQTYTKDLIEILQIADLVKFAKAQPDDDIHQSFMSKARLFVENTKVIESKEKDIASDTEPYNKE